MGLFSVNEVGPFLGISLRCRDSAVLGEVVRFTQLSLICVPIEVQRVDGRAPKCFSQSGVFLFWWPLFHLEEISPRQSIKTEMLARVCLSFEMKR